MKTALRIAAALAAAAFALPAAAILTRADRDDDEYRELATRYTSAVALVSTNGAGVLVAPRWVLTTASRAVVLRDAKAAARIRIAGRAHEILEIFVHPAWKPGGESDIALVRLREAVTEMESTPIYRDGDEAGKAVRVVGFGETGRIGAKATSPPDGRVRASINTVDRVEPRTLELRIKPPEDASDLQGAAAPGDGGAPAFFEIEGNILVAGLYASTEDTNGDGIRGNIGDWERFTRVSVFAAWIDEVTGKVAAEEAAALMGDTERR